MGLLQGDQSCLLNKMILRLSLTLLVHVIFLEYISGGNIPLVEMEDLDDPDPLDNLSEEAFEIFFHEEDLKEKDPEEFKRRAEALKANEEEVKEVDLEYLAGDISWYDKINPLSDLPDDEFGKQKLGLKPEFARGLILENYTDPESEAYFDKLRLNRAQLPKSFSSVQEGWVTPVKDQMQCGSCVAFASMPAVETCFKKITGEEDDYSEQQMVDCGYRYENGPDGCNGAPIRSYLKWAAANNVQFAHESKYPYLNERPKLYCPRGIPEYNRGAKITGAWSTQKGDEKLLQQVVYENGAAVVAIQAGKNAGEARGGLSEYAGGVYTGCSSRPNIDHAVVVVGWGTEDGIDYWEIKNSWNKAWGDNGYLKLARGYNMCGIGPEIATVTCERVGGATDPPLTTAYPCRDKFNNCAQLVGTGCWQAQISEGCEKSCQLCPGMLPVESYSCYDTFSNCYQLAPRICSTDRASKCQKSCGTCPPNTPVPKPTTAAPATVAPTTRTTTTAPPSDATCT